MRSESPSAGPGVPAHGTRPVRGHLGTLGGQTAPCAVLLPGGDVVISARALAELLGVLRRQRDACRGITPPPSVPAPRWTRTLHALTDVVQRGATRHVVSRGSLGTAVFVPSANDSAASPSHHVAGAFGEGVDVAGAAKIMGVTTRYVRVLCANGGLIARKRRYRGNGSAARTMWEISADSCHAYVQNRAA